jgi:SAM-dependent methyltransferase
MGTEGPTPIADPRSPVPDAYAESAEFIDMLIGPHWNALGPVVADAVKGAEAGAGPVLDIGAGSGRGTLVLARALPDAEILAVEPSPGLRSALLARVIADDDLRARVTVLPEGILETGLPERLGAAVAMNVIGHFSPGERRALWDLLAARLAPAGRLVLNLQPPTEPVTVPRSLAGTARVGRRRYEGWAAAEPAGDAALTWHMTYRTLQDGEVVDERVVSYHWHLLAEPRLRDELARAGLALRALAPSELGTYAVTHAREDWGVW